MKSLLAVGASYQTFGSIPMITQSNDGVSWDPPTYPFQNNTDCAAVATDGSTVIISSPNGELSVTSDLENFHVYPDLLGFGLVGLGHSGNNWMAAGQRLYKDGYGPYQENSEVAQIYVATSPHGPWTMVFTSPEYDSRFYQLKRFSNAPIGEFSSNVWIACGSAFSSGDAWYSIDDGNTWAHVSIPLNAPPIYSVGLLESDGKLTWYWGCRGRIYKSLSLQDNIWEEILISTSDAAISMVSSPNNEMLITGTNALYITRNGIRFTSWSYPGYVFDHVERINASGGSRWLAFARSNLTQYTTWYSDDLANWYPDNNSIHVRCTALTA